MKREFSCTNSKHVWGYWRPRSKCQMVYRYKQKI